MQEPYHRRTPDSLRLVVRAQRKASRVLRRLADKIEGRPLRRLRVIDMRWGQGWKPHDGKDGC